MEEVYFGKTVKYKGTTYLPNTKFKVDDKDIDGKPVLRSEHMSDIDPVKLEMSKEMLGL